MKGCFMLNREANRRRIEGFAVGSNKRNVIDGTGRFLHPHTLATTAARQPSSTTSSGGHSHTSFITIVKIRQVFCVENRLKIVKHKA